MRRRFAGVFGRRTRNGNVAESLSWTTSTARPLPPSPEVRVFVSTNCCCRSLIYSFHLKRFLPSPSACPALMASSLLFIVFRASSNLFLFFFPFISTCHHILPGLIYVLIHFSWPSIQLFSCILLYLTSGPSSGLQRRLERHRAPLYLSTRLVISIK